MIGFVIIFICYTEIIMAALPTRLNDNNNLQCQPRKIYRSFFGYCKCTEDGNWPDKYCRSYYQPQQNEQECKPNDYIIVGCNVCRCSSDGTIDKSQCTKHVCKESVKKFRRSSTNNVCQTGMWYTLSPCRICYCVNKHKLLCNNKYDSPKVQVGKHDLNMCGGDLLDDLQELVHSNTKNTDNKRIDKSKTSKKSNTSNKLSKKIKTSSKSDKHSKERNREKAYKEEYDMNLNEDRTKNNIEGETDNPLYESDILIGTDVKWGEESDERGSNKIKIKLPTIFNKFLNFVMRKSMVSIDSGTACTPGTSKKVDCNTCFCLVNGNLICTKNQCN